MIEQRNGLNFDRKVVFGQKNHYIFYKVVILSRAIILLKLSNDVSHDTIVLYTIPNVTYIDQ